MEENLTLFPFGRLIVHTVPVEGKTVYHSFIFDDKSKQNYLVVAVPNGNDPFYKAFEKQNSKTPDNWDYNKSYLKVLEKLLKIKNKKYEIFKDEAGYIKYIDLENQNDSLGLMLLTDLSGRRDTEFHYGIKPYKSLEALKYQFHNRIESRKKIRSKQAINASEINTKRIELSVIEDYENEIKKMLAISDNQQLVDDERDNANEFLDWLETRKVELKETTKPKAEQKVAIERQTDNALTFDLYLNEKGKPLLPKLKKEFKGTKPVNICLMLFALIELKYLSQNLMQINKTKLYNALVNTFGEIGTRQNFNSNIIKINGQPDYYQSDIKACKVKITSL